MWPLFSCPLCKAIIIALGSCRWELWTIILGRAGELGNHQRVCEQYHPLAPGRSQAGCSQLMPLSSVSSRTYAFCSAYWPLLSTLLRSRYTTNERELHLLRTSQRLYNSIGRVFQAAATAIVRKVSNMRVWGLGRLTGFCNPGVPSICYNN